MHVLMFSADKVEKNSSEGLKEVWKRGHGVQSDRMTIRDENLIIKEFMASDAGTYRVLDSEGEILVTVTVTGERNSDMWKYYFLKHLDRTAEIYS